MIKQIYKRNSFDWKSRSTKLTWDTFALICTQNLYNQVFICVLFFHLILIKQVYYLFHFAVLHRFSFFVPPLFVQPFLYRPFCTTPFFVQPFCTAINTYITPSVFFRNIHIAFLPVACASHLSPGPGGPRGEMGSTRWHVLQGGGGAKQMLNPHSHRPTQHKRK